MQAINRLGQRATARRSFLQLGLTPLLGFAGFRGLSAAEVSQSKESKAQRVILVWLDGGPSTIDMWDPKPTAPSSIRGEFQSIKSSVPGLHLTEHLPETAKVMDRCVLVRSLSHSIPAHGPGSVYMLTGQIPSARGKHPAMGSIVASQLDAQKSLPPFVSLGSAGPFNGNEAGFLDTSMNPFRIKGNAVPTGVTLGKVADIESFERRIELRNLIDQSFDQLNGDKVVEGLGNFSQRAVEVLKKDVIRKAIDVENVRTERRELYGNSSLGKNALRAARLVESGARFVSVGYSGWDTHSNNFGQLRNQLLPPLDKALSGLVTDLDARGLLDSTIVLCCGEFGRTPEVNQAGGRDHWSSASTVFLAGGGLKQGLAHGKTDELGREPIEDECSPADIAATILHQLGIDPKSKVETPNGREIQLLRSGTPIQAIC